jgi:hypothetical protein
MPEETGAASIVSKEREREWVRCWIDRPLFPMPRESVQKTGPMTMMNTVWCMHALTSEISSSCREYMLRSRQEPPTSCRKIPPVGTSYISHHITGSTTISFTIPYIFLIS